MPLRVRTFLCFVALLGLCRSLEAQTRNVPPPSFLTIPQDLSALTTGGAWKHGDDLGYFRIVVFDEGWEHIRSRVFIQWLFVSDPDSLPREHALVSLDSLVLPDVPYLEAYAIGSPTLRLRDDAWFLILCGTNSYSGIPKRWTIRLGAPGQWSVTEVLSRAPANAACY